VGDPAWIAYQTNRSGSEGVWLIHPDGTEDHQIATGGPNVLLPYWSPDGKRLVVASRGGDSDDDRHIHRTIDKDVITTLDQTCTDCQP
jgi:Tol biopolymer transport system component